jgi:hypothetical protein
MALNETVVEGGRVSMTMVIHDRIMSIRAERGEPDNDVRMGEPGGRLGDERRASVENEDVVGFTRMASRSYADAPDGQG